MQLTFDVEIKGSGAAGTAPELGVLLKGCGFGETVVAVTSVTYAPAPRVRTRASPSTSTRTACATTSPAPAARSPAASPPPRWASCRSPLSATSPAPAMWPLPRPPTTAPCRRW
ncbi:MAG: hypothetical protein MZW92_31855 [Comamonadaceae bacterium]|nr:hypothetical protein [Comamonadaceae bacterium]